MNLVTRLLPLVGMMVIASCGQAPATAPQQTPRSPALSADRSATSFAAPSYTLVNDTTSTVSVTGCGQECPHPSLAPGARLDFSISNGRVTVRRPDGAKTCSVFLDGVIPPTSKTRKVLLLSRDFTTTAC